MDQDQSIRAVKFGTKGAKYDHQYHSLLLQTRIPFIENKIILRTMRMKTNV